jgi:hypothetical protein
MPPEIHCMLEVEFFSISVMSDHRLIFGMFFRILKNTFFEIDNFKHCMFCDLTKTNFFKVCQIKK